MRLPVGAVLLTAVLAVAPRAQAVPPAEARAAVAAAFLNGDEGPEPASIAGTDARAEEARALAAGLRELRRGSTLDKVTAFAEAVDPVVKPVPPPEVLALYLRGTASAARPAAAAPDETARAARARERALSLLSVRAALGPGLTATEEVAVPRRRPETAPPAPNGSIRAAPVFSSAEKGAVVPALNAAARTEVASIDDRLAAYGRDRADAWADGRRVEAAWWGAVQGAGIVLRETWRAVDAVTGRDSAKHIAELVLYQPAAVADYARKQAGLPSPREAPLSYAAGSALNLVVLGVEALPGSKVASTSAACVYRGLVRDSHEALHDLRAAEAEMAATGTAEARARFETARAELDSARRRMVEYRMQYALDHEFHGSVRARALDGRDVEALNGRFVAEGGSPPFHTGVTVYEVEATRAIELCRTHRAADLERLRASRAPNGDWFIPCATVSHYDQAHLRDLLALPDSNATEFVARFTVPPGTKFYVGAAGPIRGETASRVERMYVDAEGRAVGGGGNGGKLQFFLDPHINGPRDEGVRGSLAAVSAHHQSVRGNIRYLESVPVPVELPAGVLSAH